MRILFSTFGSLGDIHPYIAVALAARARGHEPIIATSPRYRSKIEALGLSFRAVRPDVPAKEDFAPLARQVMDTKNGSRYLFRELLMPTLRDNYFDLLEVAADADVVVTHPAAMGGPLAARKLRKLWVSSVLSPISLWSRYDPPVPPTLAAMEKLRILGPLWGRVSLEFARGLTRAWVTQVGELAAAEGIPDSGHPIFEGSFSPHGTLALFSPLFGPPQLDWPANCVATGFCFYDGAGYEGQRQSNWRDWVEAGPPPLVITLGSTAVFGADVFFAKSREYALNLKQRVLLLKGLDADGESENGQIMEKDYAPYSELFPLAGVLIHQGGIGTTAQALRAGVPQLVVPFAHDQPDNAARVRRLGLGLTISRRAFECGPLPEKYLLRMVENPEFFRNMTQDFAVRLSREDGPNSACAHLERIGDGSL